MFDYIKKLILADTQERVSAFLAVIAGMTLCIGFLVAIFNSNIAEVGLITAGLVSLSTFNRVDQKPPKLPDA